MKKLLLVTGIFLSLGLMASAQVKKTTTAASTTTQAPQKKKTIKTLQQERIAQKNAIEKANAAKGKGAVKKGTTAPGASEKLETKAN